MQESLKSTVMKIPLLTINAGPRFIENYDFWPEILIKNIRDANWIDRLKEEYIALIKYIELNKAEDNDWFKIESNKEGTKYFS